MPWKEIGVMDQKFSFVIKALSREIPFAELCKEYCIAPKTGYKWLKRFKDRGRIGLAELSRRPSSSPWTISADDALEIVALKKKHPTWGARKIRILYRRIHPSDNLPALSTFTRIFERAELVHHKKRKHYPQSDRIQKRIIPSTPNDVWTVDFKGWWFTPQHDRINPLTVRDEYAKAVLAATIMEKGDTPCIKREFERLFSSFGLPKCIRSDNGPPFASHFNALGLTKLSVWWMSLGIQLDRIDPGCPYQNGGHERMHLDMANELEGHVFGSLKEQQKTLDIWRHEYNYVRPHEALGMKCPSEVYKKSERPYDADIEDVAYPPDFLERKVNTRGVFHYQKRRYFVGNPFDGYTIGIHLIKGGKPEIWFACFLIGFLDVESGIVEFQSGKNIARAS
jgi:transposase InsO family protein